MLPFLTFLALVLVSPVTAPATVTVDAQFGALEHGLPALIDCPVSVPQGATGIAVLDAAVAGGCISSYSLQHFSFGDFVSCIDGVCSQDAVLEGTFWAFSVNGACTSYGVDAYRATQGDVFRLDHSDYYTACTL